MANTRPAKYKPRRNTKEDRKRQLKRKLRQSNVANGGLTPKIQSVINHYFENGFHQGRAMMAAGYSEGSAKFAQFHIFGRPDVKAEIERRMRAITEKSEVDGDWLMRKLKLMIDANLGDILRKLATFDYDINCLSDEELFVLGDIIVEHGSEVAGYEKDGTAIIRPTIKVKVKTEGKTQMIVTALRKLGLFKDSLEVKTDADVVAALTAGRRRASKVAEK